MKDDVDSFETCKYISNSVPDLTNYLVIFIIISIVFYIFAAENQKKPAFVWNRKHFDRVPTTPLTISLLKSPFQILFIVKIFFV